MVENPAENVKTHGNPCPWCGCPYPNDHANDCELGDWERKLFMFLERVVNERRSQTVRQESAKLPIAGSIPAAASNDDEPPF